MNISAKYQKQTDKEHVLSPQTCDMYIGSIRPTETTTWVYDQGMALKTGSCVPGLLKIFDELVVNCRDHTVRKLADPVTRIDVTIQDGEITMYNDGTGIDVVLHPEHGVYVPELIFMHLRTSTNYDPTEKKIVGGKNGYGAKLAFIWAQHGVIETVDSERGLKYTQSFSRNLYCIDTPVIKPCKNKPYTKITFKPEYHRFGLDGLDDFHRQLFTKRI